MADSRSDETGRYRIGDKRRVDREHECPSIRQFKTTESSRAKRFQETPNAKRSKFNEDKDFVYDSYPVKYSKSKIYDKTPGSRGARFCEPESWQGEKERRRYYEPPRDLEYKNSCMDELSSNNNVKRKLNGDTMFSPKYFDTKQLNPQVCFDKKTAFLLALKDSPKSAKLPSEDKDEVAPMKQLKKFPNTQKLFVGNLFNPVENDDLERLLETYGSIVEVRRYEKHAIVTLNCSKDKAEQAIKDLDHNNWMENWIRVKFNMFEMTKEESWKKKRKFCPPSHAKYSHCDRATDEPSESQGIMHSEYERELKSPKVSSDTQKCKIVDVESKRALSKHLRVIRHEHCVEMVDSFVNKHNDGKSGIASVSGSSPVINGIPITTGKQDPRSPIDYKDIDF